MSLTTFGRTRLSESFFMRDFLFSEIAAIGGMTFYSKYWAFNLGWHEQPVRSIHSSIPPKTGYITRPGWENGKGSHEQLWRGVLG